MPITVNEEQLNDLIINSDIVFVDFWANWCAPCKIFAKIYEKVEAENPDLSFTAVNIEEHASLAQIFEIQSIPHLLIFKNGIIIYSDSGSIPESTLNELCAQARAVDMSKITEENQ